MQHLIVAPIVLPLLTAAVLLLLDKDRRRVRSLLSVGATLASLVVAVVLLRRVAVPGAPAVVGVYLAGNWEAPFGIVLVADRLSALMLMLAGVVGCCVALYAEARWARVGVYFQPLFQIQLMGLNGAFLTGDLFNLFVFFEVMLAASYGLQLHGSGWPRVRSGLHYIAVNLLASSLFLIGLAVTYGVMGSLSMADIAGKLASVPASDRGLLHAGMAAIGVAFLIKAAAWPLNAWLVPAYSAASAPVAALFALMTKVGIYVLLRLWTLFSADAGGLAHFGDPVLVVGGLATIGVGAVGLLSSIHLGRIASFSILVTSGTLLASLGLGEPAVTGAALFYLVTSTLAVSALFLLVEPVERMEPEGKADQAQTSSLDEDTNLDDEEEPLVGRAIPVSVALLGMVFVSSSLLVAGLPPLSGFVAKVALLSSVVNAEGARHSNSLGPLTSAWWIMGLVLVSGLLATVSLSRAGIRHFWSVRGQRAPRVKRVEAISVVALVTTGVLLSLFAEPVLRYTAATAKGLYAPGGYVEAVMSSKPRPGPTRLQVDRSVPRAG
jgi:multicomponent K+:H+ antiporter subunit D